MFQEVNIQEANVQEVGIFLKKPIKANYITYRIHFLSGVGSMIYSKIVLYIFNNLNLVK